jgi:hypothetical protein
MTHSCGSTPFPGETSSWMARQGPTYATAELGCLYAGSKVDSVSGSPTGPIALVLYRAGALIAVNAQAHQIFPTVPVASDHERLLATAVAPAHLG